MVFIAFDPGVDQIHGGFCPRGCLPEFHDQQFLGILRRFTNQGFYLRESGSAMNRMKNPSFPVVCQIGLFLFFYGFQYFTKVEIFQFFFFNKFKIQIFEIKFVTRTDYAVRYFSNFQVII